MVMLVNLGVFWFSLAFIGDVGQTPLEYFNGNKGFETQIRWIQ